MHQIGIYRAHTWRIVNNLAVFLLNLSVNMHLNVNFKTTSGWSVEKPGFTERGLFVSNENESLS